MADLLIGSFVLPFEAVSLLLLAALIGGLALARSRRASGNDPRDYADSSRRPLCNGLYGALARSNVIAVLMSIEIMFNAVNLTVVAFSKYVAPWH